MAFALMYVPLTKKEALGQAIMLIHRCCACHRCLTITSFAFAVIILRTVISFTHSAHKMLFVHDQHLELSWSDENVNRITGYERF
eukprot:1770519-Amphidinium_carterae.1